MRKKNFSSTTKFVKSKHLFLKIVLFFITFFSLIYILFPNKLLKSYLESSIQRALSDADLPLSVKINSARLYWITGIELNEVALSNIYDSFFKKYKIPRVTFRISVLPLLIGKIHLNASIDLKTGSSSSFASLPLIQVIKGNVKDFYFETEFKNFEIQGLVNQYFNTLYTSNNPSIAIITPILKKLDVEGYLNGDFEFERSDHKDDGSINLIFDKLYFNLMDPNLKIPKQHFKKASINISWIKSDYKVQDETVFESENMYFMPKGSVKMIGVGANAVPVLNLDVLFILSGPLEKNFGFLVPQLLKCPSSTMTGGVMNVKLSGPLSQYTCQ